MDDSTTMRVVSAVANATGRDVIDLPPLAEAVDPDALEAIVADREDGQDVEVQFFYAGRDVTVGTGGDVSVATAAGDPPEGRGRTD